MLSEYIQTEFCKHDGKISSRPTFTHRIILFFKKVQKALDRSKEVKYLNPFN